MRIATTQALVLLPEGLRPILEALNAADDDLSNIRHALGIFEPKHCVSYEAFVNRLQEEREYYRNNHIELKDPSTNKPLNTEAYFKKFSQAITQLYAFAVEYNYGPYSSRSRDTRYINKTALIDSIKRNGLVQRPWVRKELDNGEFTLQWGVSLAEAFEHSKLPNVDVYCCNREATPYSEKTDTTFITELKEAYKEWDEYARTVIEKSGTILLIDPKGRFTSNNKIFTLKESNCVILQPQKIDAMFNTSLENAVLGCAFSQQKASDKTGTGQLEADDNKNILPLSHTTKQEQLELVRNYADAIRINKPAPRYQASDTAFVINNDQDELTPPQHEYFIKLNEIIALLGVTPKKFDDHFRLAVAKVIYYGGVDTAKVLYSKIDKITNGKVTYSGNNKLLEKCKQQIDLDRYLGVHRLEGAPKGKLGALGHFSGVSTIAMMEYLDRYLGVFNINAEAATTSKDKDFIKKYDILRKVIQKNIEEVKGEGKAISGSKGEKFIADMCPSTEDNVIQTYASGRRSLITLQENIPCISFNADIYTHPDHVKDYKMVANGGYCQMHSVATHFHASIHNAAIHIAHSKGFPAHDLEAYAAIQQKLQELDTLWPQIFKSQEEHAIAVTREEKETIRRENNKKEAQEAAKRRLEQDVARTEIDRKKREAFMAKPQPYKFNEGGIAHELRTTLHDYADNQTDQISNYAQILVALIDKVALGLDCRSEGVEALGAMLFSAANISALATAFEAANPISGKRVPPLIASPATAAQLRTLYNFAPAVQRTIDMLLEQPDSIMLLAPLTRPLERCRNYARYLLANERALIPIRKRITDAEAQLQDFSAEDLAGLTDEPEIVTLNKARADYVNKQAEMESVREALADEIRKSFQGLNPKKIPSATVPIAELALQAKLELPPKWLKAMNGEFHPQPSEDNKYVLIASNDFPYKYVPIKLTAGEEAFDRTLRTLRVECEQHRANLDALRELGEFSGFQLINQDGKTILRHPDYGIERILEGTEIEQTKTLLTAKGQFEERKLQQQSIVEMALQAGLKVPQSKYFSADDFRILQNQLDALQEIQQSLQAPPLESELDVSGKTSNTTWQPNGETMLIFDASVLSKLAVPRGDNDHTWLDIIKCTARLPNIKVIIPAVIADWELQGKISVYDKEGNRTGFEQVDSRFQKRGHRLHYVAEPIAKFLQSASRAKIETDGTVSLEPGANSNIIIMETEGDKELYDRIRNIINQPGGDQIEAFQKYIHKQDEGEKATNRILAEMPHELAAMIISDDNNYFCNPNAPVRAPLTTGRGMPVGQSGLGCYLEAELRYRERLLRKSLTVNKRLTLYNLGNEINAYWEQIRPDDYVYFGNYSQCGQYATPNGKKADYIHHLIETGVKLHEASRIVNNTKIDSDRIPANDDTLSDPGSVVFANHITVPARSGGKSQATN